jgi:hypothetical protein
MPRQACLVLSTIYSLSPPGASDLDLSIADICFEFSFFSLFCSAVAPVLGPDVEFLREKKSTFQETQALRSHYERDYRSGTVKGLTQFPTSLFFCRRRYRWPLFSVIADASSKYFSLS